MATESEVLRGRLDLPLLLTLAFLAIVIALLFAGGYFVRSIVVSAFGDAERIRTARVHVGEMLRQQLDEETGVRGYVALRNPIMLESYYGGHANLSLYFRRVHTDLEALKVNGAQPALTDAERTNYRWVHEVAFPLIAGHGRHPQLQLRGKTLIDRFRIDANAIDADLARRTLTADARAQRAIVWIGVLAVAAVAVVILAALVFALQQYRLAMRLERQRAATEVERRKTAEARAAYETEKRIADVLQDAFAERVFPDVPALRFSATYIPATEETKIGGDWYDALELSEERVLLAIGDVTGHGIEAVVAMNKARQLLIASALLDAEPGRILQRVNGELVRSKSPIITALAGVIDTRAQAFTYAAAGHPPPVVVEPERGARLLEFGSLPLGVTPNVIYASNRVRLPARAMIVLYTDGAIEFSRDLAEGEAILLHAAESAARASESDAARTIREAIFTKRNVTDDVAILTVRFSYDAGSLSLARKVSRTFIERARGGNVLGSGPATRRGA